MMARLDLLVPCVFVGHRFEISCGWAGGQRSSVGRGLAFGITTEQASKSPAGARSAGVGS